MQRIQQEQTQLDGAALGSEIATLEQQACERQQSSEQLQTELEALRARIEQLRQETRRQQHELHEAQNRQQSLGGRLASLQALQQAALGEGQGAAGDWLQGQALAEAPRLAKQLEVDAGWERAVETALGEHLEAVCVDSIERYADALGAFSQGTLTLADTQAAPEAGAGLAEPLTAKVRAAWPLGSLLAGVYAVESLAEALRLRTRLAAHESVITPDGVWIGPGWLRVARAQDARSGVLEREKEINRIEEELKVNKDLVADLETQLEAARDELRQAETSFDDIQRQANQAHRQFSDVRAQLEARRTRLEQMEKRAEALQREAAEIEAQQEEDNGAVTNARGALHQALALLETLADERERRAAEREQLRTTLDGARAQAQSDRDRAHQLELQYQTWHTEQETTTQNLERMRGQLERLQQRRDELSRSLSEGEAPMQEQEQALATLLQSRLAVETELGEERRKVETLEHSLRENEQLRHRQEQATQQLRDVLSREKLAWQEIKVRGETLLEQIAGSGFELATLVEELDAEASLEAWESELESLNAKIQRLGPINLAAIGEFEEQSERKKYLDAQYEDISSALTTLEDAIRKIDRETRTRFKETFDKVNSGLQAMFPRLFGGGHAYLEMTGEDLLDTGVTIMARPPGKRNSTIHLLSGGEKALTAVALVFSIFELNPSPFCMLDEVDAPLDDANVGRFCDMVREMSERVQFVFITHNKITMDLANQLTGVTMHEPGVSRLVAVDVDEAVQLAAV